MGKFKSKPVFVEAEQWLGKEEQVERLLSENVIMKSAARDGSVLVPTLGGNLTCNLNDYIVTDSKGVRSVVDAETFEATYELAEGEEVFMNGPVIEESVGSGSIATNAVEAIETVAEETVAPVEEAAATEAKDVAGSEAEAKE